MTRHLVILACLLFMHSLCGCSQNVTQSAASGAAGGAAASALGSLVVGLIFNDENTAERVARSAVYGATVGAAAGAAAGAQKDAKEKALTTDDSEKNDIRNMNEEEFLKVVGPYNFSASLALRDCNYDEARRQALKAFQSDNRDFREASLWRQAVIASETSDKEALKYLHQQLAAYNPELGQPDKAKAGLGLLLDTLHEDRRQHGLAPTCN